MAILTSTQTNQFSYQKMQLVNISHHLSHQNITLIFHHHHKTNYRQINQNLQMLLFISTTTTTATTTTFSLLVSLTKRRFSLSTAMSSINLQSHAFAGNPIKAKTPKPTSPISPISSFETLKTHLLNPTHNPVSPSFKVLPFRKGRPLAGSGSNPAKWHLGWISLSDWKGISGGGDELRDEVDNWVYLGCKEGSDDEVYWAIDVSEDEKLVDELGKKCLSFVELRTLMVATDWSDSIAMADLAVAGHARALLEWHGLSRFCGHCGSKTVPMEAGKRVQCSNELCKKRIYPRVDPVVIMLVIDRENDRALLGRQSRFVPRMWSCLAGFIEPGESLEEAVRRETWEETGIEVGEVVYHSSQPWPVGPSSMPCQLMVGFYAYAKSLEINVDKDELEDARWHRREEVKKALSLAEYEKAQRTAATKVEQICKGVKQSQNLSTDFNSESGELASMFIPGPFAIAHHLISTWVFQGPVTKSLDHAIVGGQVPLAMSFATLQYPVNVLNDANKHKDEHCIRSLPTSTSSLSSVSYVSLTSHVDETKNLNESQKFLSSPSPARCALTQNNTVGIIGGVSVLSTLIFLEKLVLWSSRNGQDSVPFIVCSDPLLRQEATKLSMDVTTCTSVYSNVGTNEYRLKALDRFQVVENLSSKRVFLEEGGAQCIVMPCHLSHAWYVETSQGCTLPFLHVAECVALELKDAKFKPLEGGSLVKIGLIATEAILAAGFYQEELQKQGFEVMLPDRATMERIIQPAINCLNQKDVQGASNLLRIAIQVLLVRAVNTVILASDELQSLLPHDDPLLKHCIDPLDALARSAVRWAKSAKDTRKHLHDI